MSIRTQTRRRPTTDTMSVRSGYFDEAMRPDEVIANARESLARVDFDTIVATGLSGTSLAMMVAHALDVKCLLVRKHDDHSNHSNKRAWGELGERWVFFDDFVSSGGTRQRVIDAVAELVEDENYQRRERTVWVSDPSEQWGGRHDPDPLPEFETRYVGDYTYNYGGGFRSANEGMV